MEQAENYSIISFPGTFPQTYKKNEFKILRDKFINNSDYLDKQHLERSALTASQLKRRIDQSRENLKIVRKGELNRDTSPLHKQQVHSDRDRQRAKSLKELLEANARWNEERKDAAKNDLRRIVDETGLSNPELQKEMIYSWEKGFFEDTEQDDTQSPKKKILRKDELRKSSQALTKPLKGKISTETGLTVKTSTGSIHQKIGYRSSENLLATRKSAERKQKSIGGTTQKASKNQFSRKIRGQ